MTEHPSFHTSTVSPEVEVPLDLQVRQHAMRARKLQAEAVAESVENAWRGLRRGVLASAHWLSQRYDRAVTRSALMACSDRTLADIGIPREHIRLAVRGVDVRDPTAVYQAGLWPRLVALFTQMNQRRRERLRVYRELMAYSDRDLEEIGLRRSDIPNVARSA